MVAPSARCRAGSSARSSPRSPASRFESGSANRNTRCARTIAPPNATRRRCPPESCAGRRSSSSVRPSRWAVSCTRRAISDSATPRTSNPKAILPRALRWGYKASFWNTMATSRSAGGRYVTSRPAIRTSPAVGSSSPAMQRRAVDLPQPDGPSSTRSSPSRTSRESSCNAGLAPPSNVFVRPRSVSDAMRLSLLGASCEGNRQRIADVAFPRRAAVELDAEARAVDRHRDAAPRHAYALERGAVDAEGHGPDGQTSAWTVRQHTHHVRHDQVVHPGVQVVVDAAVDARAAGVRVIVLEAVRPFGGAVERHHARDLEDLIAHLPRPCPLLKQHEPRQRSDVVRVRLWPPAHV